MPTVQCPICGTTNPNGRRRLARCRRCREHLAKCRYCQHYDPRLMDCLHPSHQVEERIVDADAVLNCLDFTSTLTSPPIRPRLSVALIRTTVLAGAAALVVAFGLIRSVGRYAEPPPPVLLKASVNAPATSFQDAGFDVSVIVVNKADQPARDVEVRIAGGTMRHLTCERVEPQEAFLEASHRSVAASLGDLRPGEIRSVKFHFMASRAGELNLTAYVTAANLDGPEKLPIEGEVVP